MKSEEKSVSISIYRIITLISLAALLFRIKNCKIFQERKNIQYNDF